jgi:hypothetical protein
MSIVCLKRNSRHYPQVDPISGKGKDGFSLNGGHRNVGGVGRFRMVSNVSRTPFRGNIPMGSGGCCGVYEQNVANSGSCYTNHSDIVKKSSVNTKGMINKRYERKWEQWNDEYVCPRVVLNSQYPYQWVQQDNSSYVTTQDQSLYIQKKTQAYGACVFINYQNSGNCANFDQDGQPTLSSDANSAEIPGVYNCDGNRGACSYYIGTRKFVKMPYAKNLNQPAMSQGQYIATGGPTRLECLPTPPNKQPFPMTLVHNQGMDGCDVNYDTWQEAQRAGALPQNYVG